MTHPGEALSAYLDGELGAADQRSVLAHLRGCAGCRTELAELDAARTAVRSLPVLEPPFEPAVPALSAVRRRRSRPAALIAAAAALVILVGGIGLARSGDSEPPIDIVEVINQHNVRVGVDPGMPAVQVVQVGFP